MRLRLNMSTGADSQIHRTKITTKTNNVPREPLKVDERSSSNVDHSNSNGFRKISVALVHQGWYRKFLRMVSYHKYM